MAQRAGVARAFSGYTDIITQSTVLVGTGAEIECICKEERPDADFLVVSNPEFSRESTAISDFERPDGIVLGHEDDRAR